VATLQTVLCAIMTYKVISHYGIQCKKAIMTYKVIHNALVNKVQSCMLQGLQYDVQRF